MIGLLLVAVGLLALLLGALTLRSTGPGYRIARILGAAPHVTVGEAVEFARSDPRYLRVRGRIESDEEFPDENDRPLVFRRRRVDVSEGRGWRTLDETRLAVPFAVEERTASIAVDVEALGDGLVVIPKEAIGAAREVREGLPEGVPGGAVVRLRLEQLSAVEHAFVAGLATLDADGRPTITAGRGRPLILTPLDLPAAMRILAGGKQGRVRMAAISLVLGLVVLAAGLAVSVMDVLS